MHVSITRQFGGKKSAIRDRRPDIDYPHGVSGEQTIGELMAANMLMIPFTLDPHGKWGPLTDNFLNQTTHDLHYSFRANKPNAATMLSKITRHPCPIGILKTADAIWKSNQTRPFFGHSHTSPTPSLYTIQQLGLGITKAYASHIKNAFKTIHAQAQECIEHEANSSITIKLIQ